MVVALAALAAAAVRVRSRLLPWWAGPRARLAELVIAIAGLVAIGELLGTVGLLRPLPMLVACAVAGLGAVAALRPPPPTERAIAGAGKLSRFSAVVLVGCGLVVVAQWSAWTAASLERGMWAADTLWYHGPFAAEFVQEGSITALHFTHPEALIAYYPANSELLHALAWLPFDADLISPLVNLGALALAVLGAWSLARSREAAAACALAAIIVLATPIIAASQAGNSNNDALALALFVAAAAIFVQGRGERGAAGLAALAAGLAMGTKVTLIAPALALAAGAVAVAPRGRRLEAAGVWLAGLIVGGGFWYARNLARTGSPFPWVDSVGPVALPGPDASLPDIVDDSIASRLDASGFFDQAVLPGLVDAFGPAWPALVALAAAGSVAAILRGPERAHRVLGAVALASFVAYLFTPQSGALFVFNLRHATPALLLGIASLALALPPGRPALRRGLLATLGAAFALGQLDFDGWPSESATWIIAGASAAAALAAAAALIRRASARRIRLAAVGTLVVVVVVAAAGWVLADRYLAGRYAGAPVDGLGQAFPQGLSEVYRWAESLGGESIGVAGFYVTYPLYGAELENRVEYVGRRTAHGGFARARGCRVWLRALAAGGYRFVVTAPRSFFSLDFSPVSAAPVEARWTRRARGASRLFTAPGPVSIFRLDRPPEPASCPGRQSSEAG